MKTFTFTLFIFSIHFCFSQKLIPENICSLKIDSIYNFLISPNDLTSSEIKVLATTLAEKDKKIGNNRILQNMGYSEFGCDICTYSKYGFELVPFGVDDIQIEKVDEFMVAYNQLRELELPSSFFQELIGVNYKNVFSENFTGKFYFDVSNKNDTIINVKISSEYLERLFKNNVEKLKISGCQIGKRNDSREMSYCEMKEKGFNIEYNQESRIGILVTINFENIENDFAICWCSKLRKKYAFTVPITIK